MFAFSTIFNVSEKYRKERKLRESKKEFSLLIPSGNIKYFNSSGAPAFILIDNQINFYQVECDN